MEGVYNAWSTISSKIDMIRWNASYNPSKINWKDVCDCHVSFLQRLERRIFDNEPYFDDSDETIKEFLYIFKKNLEQTPLPYYAMPGNPRWQIVTSRIVPYCFGIDLLKKTKAEEKKLVPIKLYRADLPDEVGCLRPIDSEYDNLIFWLNPQDEIKPGIKFMGIGFNPEQLAEWLKLEDAPDLDELFFAFTKMDDLRKYKRKFKLPPKPEDIGDEQRKRAKNIEPAFGVTLE